MKIAVTSQNRREVTAHAGRCRNFWIFTLEDGRILDRSLLELPKESSFHDSEPHDPHPIDGVAVLITGGMGGGLRARLGRKGIESIVTTETDPRRAVELWLGGTLPVSEPRPDPAADSTKHGAGCACS